MIEVRDVSVRFGGLDAVSELSFTAREGASNASIRPTGARQTPPFHVPSGVQPPAPARALGRGRS